MESCGDPRGGPTSASIAAWNLSVLACALCFALVVATGHWAVAVVGGVPAGIAFALGHNFVHQPQEFSRAWTMELLGVSRDDWYCRHNFQHHMYTNTEKDTHFWGAPPFFTPNEDDGLHMWLPRVLYAIVLPVCAFGLIVPGMWLSGHLRWQKLRSTARRYNQKQRANQTAHKDEPQRSEPEYMEEPASFGWRLILPAELGILIFFHGGWGVLLFWLMKGTCGAWFFLLGIVNHYDGQVWDESYIQKLDPSDYAARQLLTTCDIGPGGESFVGSFKYLFFNYHLVHHLFPNVDAAHHPQIDRIISEVAAEFGLLEHRRRASLWSLYWNMVCTLCSRKTKAN